MDNELYVPILKWKAGEKEAIRQLTPNQKKDIAPLIEIVDSIGSSDLIKELEDTISGTVLLDNILSDGMDLDFFRDITSKSKKVNPIPVFYIDHLFSNTSIINEFKEISIRLEIPEPIDSLSYTTFFKNLFKNRKTKIDLILDLIFVENSQVATIKFTALKSILTDLLEYNKFINKIIISSTSFPKDLNGLEAGKDMKYKRYEVMLFNKIKIASEFAEIKNKLIYCDYGVNKFTDTNIDFSKLQYGVLPKIKYTTDNFYYVQKGEKDRIKNTYIVSVFDMANNIVKSESFYGKDFSYGDREIFDRSKKEKGPGSNTNWVTISTTHHIAVILSQLSK